MKLNKNKNHRSFVKPNKVSRPISIHFSSFFFFNIFAAQNDHRNRNVLLKLEYFVQFFSFNL